MSIQSNNHQEIRTTINNLVARFLLGLGVITLIGAGVYITHSTNLGTTPIEIETVVATPATDYCAITSSKFTAVRIGMSYQQVRDIVGCDGDQASPDPLTLTYTWAGAQEHVMQITMRNNMVVDKLQSGMKR